MLTEKDLTDWSIGKNVYRWIRENIPDGSTILEFGSGIGTQLLSQDYKMCSVEHNLKWIDKYDSHYCYASIINGWYDGDAVNDFMIHQIDGFYDNDIKLILIDGPTGNYDRSLILGRKSIVLDNVNVIVDDTNRTNEMNIALQLIEGDPFTKEKREFEIIKDGNKQAHIFS